MAIAALEPVSSRLVVASLEGEAISDLSWRVHGPGAVLEILGPLEGALARRLRELLLTLQTERVSEIAVDLSQCHPLSRVGVGVLVGGSRACRSRGGRFFLRGVTGQPRDLLSTVGLHHRVAVDWA